MQLRHSCSGASRCMLLNNSHMMLWCMHAALCVVHKTFVAPVTRKDLFAKFSAALGLMAARRMSAARWQRYAVALLEAIQTRFMRMNVQTMAEKDVRCLRAPMLSRTWDDTQSTTCA